MKIGLAIDRIHDVIGFDDDMAGLYVAAIAAIIAILWYAALAPDSPFCRLSPPEWEAWYECRFPWEWR